MQLSTFDGQQDGEKILAALTPHPLTKTLSIVGLVLLILLFSCIAFMIGSVVPIAGGTIKLVGVLLSAIILITGIWWIETTFKKAITYITDRRVMRFDVTTPFFTTKRALFWNEVLKAKAYAPNIILKSLNIGEVVLEPIAATEESICISNVSFYEDIANYIDKILYTTKNKLQEMDTFKPFIFKSKGHRG